jgi:hypothetical protein
MTIRVWLTNPMREVTPLSGLLSDEERTEVLQQVD